jgi:hypothetical protein
VLPPVFRDFGALRRFCGPVVSVKCFEYNSLVKAAVDSSGMLATPQGPLPAVLVVDGGASLRRAISCTTRPTQDGSSPTRSGPGFAANRCTAAAEGLSLGPWPQ